MSRPLVLAGGTLVLQDDVARADLVIDEGTIAAIDGPVPSHATVVDCSGCHLLPGLIDVHTDNIERHVELRPGMFWPPARAVLAHDAELAGAGVTTAFDAITIGGSFADAARHELAVRVIASLAAARHERLLRIDHRLHVRCELSDPALPALLASLGDVQPEIVSLMNHTPGRRQWRDLDRFRSHYRRRYGLSDREVDALIATRQASDAAAAPANRTHALALAATSGARLASHDDTEVADADEAAAAGCVLAEFPTTAEAAARASARGMAVIAGAPNLVRGASHSGNVSAAVLVRHGHVDVLSSDYCPSSLLQAVFLLHDTHGWRLAEAVRTASSTPARLLGLDDRGVIAAGRRADVIVVQQTGLGPVIRETWVAGARVF